MRHILYKVAGFVGATMLAGPVMAATPEPGTVRDMACFMIMGHAVGEAEAAGKGPSGSDNLKLATFYFAGKVSTRNPGKTIMTVVEANRTAVQAALAKQDPGACAREVHVAMANPEAGAGAGAGAPKPKP
ncbi:MAG TPA: hypothetical protein VF503_17330 [Sphingobium sp.]|uniref:hypothetical protein n=1 Tax=Sphingobium sp. TaxID=1912891 RepID=UPI002ED4F236